MTVEVVTEDELERPAFDYAELGRPIRGPRALSSDWRRIWHLSYNVALMQWKVKFFGSALGYVWQLVRPLLLFLTLYVFFTKVARVGAQPGPQYHAYGAQLLGSLVLFTFFGEATGAAVRSVVDNEALVRKIHFPRIVIPFSVVMLSLFNLGLNLVVVLIFALIAGVDPMLTWFEVPLILLLLIILSSGVAMLLSALYVYFRDLAPIWEVVSQVIFYASPVIVPLDIVRQHLSPQLVRVYMMNPLATAFQQFRHAFITHGTPSAGALLGSMAYLVIPVGISVAIFVLGFWVFNRTAPKVAEDV